YSPRSKYFPLQIPQSSMARTETLDRTLQQMHCLLSQSFCRWRGLHKSSTAYHLSHERGTLALCERASNEVWSLINRPVSRQIGRHSTQRFSNREAVQKEKELLLFI